MAESADSLSEVSVGAAEDGFPDWLSCVLVGLMRVGEQEKSRADPTKGQPRSKRAPRERLSAERRITLEFQDKFFRSSVSGLTHFSLLNVSISLRAVRYVWGNMRRQCGDWSFFI